MRVFHKAVAALLFLATPADASDFPYESFRPSSLSELQAREDVSAAEIPARLVGSQIINGLARARVRATYTGERRPLGLKSKQFIAEFSRAMQAPAGYADLFREEFLFKAEGRDWWLPVQAQLTSSLGAELRPGDRVELYVVAAGSVLTKEGWHTVFLIEEFQARK